MVVAAVIARYTLLDDLLGQLIVQYLSSEAKHDDAFWSSDKYRTIQFYILDEMYMLKKMAAVDAIQPLPKNVKKLLKEINALRNAFAHSIFSEHRKEYEKTGKVLHASIELRTPAGLKVFLDDCEIVFKWLYARYEAP
jgi:hypothetical protein